MLKVAPGTYGSLNVARPLVASDSVPWPTEIVRLQAVRDCEICQSYIEAGRGCREMCSHAPTLHASAQT
jgi:hypothetical protein